jgi:hypothetical protein
MNFKVDKTSGIFGLAKDSYQHFRKGIFFFIFSGFLFIWGFVSNNLKNGPSER